MYFQIKTSYHYVHTQHFDDMEDFYVNIFQQSCGHWQSSHSDLVVGSVTVLYKSIPGIAILATSRAIPEEAKTVLNSKLQYLCTGPVQIVADTFAIRTGDITETLSCLCRTICGSHGDVRVLSDIGHFDVRHHDPRPQHYKRPRKVVIAIRNQFVDRHESERNDTRMTLIKNLLDDDKQHLLVD